jgi:hypothetical protein
MIRLSGRESKADSEPAESSLTLAGSVQPAPLSPVRVTGPHWHRRASHDGGRTVTVPAVQWQAGRGGLPG